MCIFVLDEALNSICACTDIVGIIHIHINSFQSLPSHPVLNAAFEHAVGNDQHLHRSLPKVGMLVIYIPDGTAIEQLLVKDIEIGAIGLHQYILCGTDIGTIEADSDFNVVEHTQGVVDGVVAHWLDAQLTYLNTTHSTIHAHAGSGFRTETTGLISGFVIHERHILGILVFENVRLARH